MNGTARMVHAWVRTLFLLLIRFFYRPMSVSGAQRIPTEGPVLVVCNHPNGLMDPLVLCAALDRPVSFLAKSTLFGNAVSRLVLDAFSAIPVYRPKDGEDTRKNEDMFARCRTLLRDRGWLVVFPEGVSHSDPQLRPLKTGTARMALGTEAESGFQLGLRILPVGLTFEQKEIFRSPAAVTVGEPFTITELASRYQQDERACITELTARMREALNRVILSAESDELWRGFLAVAAWTDPSSSEDPALRQERARQLADAWDRLADEDPERAERVVYATRRFVRVLKSVGVEDPLRLEERTVDITRAVVSLMPLMFAAPFAALGALLGWAPYRLLRPWSFRLANGDIDIIGTLKMLLGVVVLPAWWGLEAWLLGAWLGWPVGVAVLLLAPLTGFVAIRFDERVALRKDVLRAFWLRLTKARVAEAVVMQRHQLCNMVEAELARDKPAPSQVQPVHS